MKHFLWILIFFCSFATLFSQFSLEDMEPVAKYFQERLNSVYMQDTTMTDEQIMEALSKMPLDTAFLKQYDTDMSYLLKDSQFGALHQKQGVIDTAAWYLGCDGLPYAELKVVWENGLPRTGILTACSGKKHIVNYFPVDVNPSNGFVSQPPKITDSKFEYADRNIHQFKIMNAFTGAIDTTILTEPTTDYIVRDLAVMLKDTKVKPPPEAREHITYLPPAYKLYSFETLPAGVYIIALFNEKDEIINVKTYRKN